MSPRRQKKTNFPILLLIAGGMVLLVAAVLLLTQGGGSPSAASPTAENGSDIPFPEIERVSLASARSALDAGTALFLDVRGADVYAISRITGAISIPQAEIESRLSELDPNQWIIPYCT